MLKYYVTFQKPGLTEKLYQERRVFDSKTDLQTFIEEAGKKSEACTAFEKAVGRPRSGYQPKYEIVQIIEGTEIQPKLIQEQVEVLVGKHITRKEWKL